MVFYSRINCVLRQMKLIIF